jgi:hypothetical protein
MLNSVIAGTAREDRQVGPPNRSKPCKWSTGSLAASHTFRPTNTLAILDSKNLNSSQLGSTKLAANKAFICKQEFEPIKILNQLEYEHLSRHKLAHQNIVRAAWYSLKSLRDLLERVLQTGFDDAVVQAILLVDRCPADNATRKLIDVADLLVNYINACSERPCLVHPLAASFKYNELPRLHNISGALGHFVAIGLLSRCKASPQLTVFVQ